MKSTLRYLNGYPEDVLERIQTMLENGESEQQLFKGHDKPFYKHCEFYF